MNNNSMNIMSFEEKIGAYIENKLSVAEKETFEKLIDDNIELKELVEDISFIEIDTDSSIATDFPDFMENFELPIVPMIDSVEYTNNLDLIDNEDIEIEDCEPDNNYITDDNINNNDIAEITNHSFDCDNNDIDSFGE